MFALCILAMTCSMVGVVKLTERRTLATSREPSTAVGYTKSGTVRVRVTHDLWCE